MKIFLLIIGFLFLIIGITALVGQSDILNLPFALIGLAEKVFGILALVAALIAYLLSTEAKKSIS